jgi:myosin heavy subunit
MPELFVFKAGKYPQGDWPEERVKKLVNAYDPENSYEAPAVIGHQFLGTGDAYQYAHGWVESLRMDKDGKVYAVIPEFSRKARQAIIEKKLRYVSVEIFENDKINEGEAPYLKAVALLGRDTPAVQGTKIPAMFNVLSGGVVNTVDEKNHISIFTRKVKPEEIKLLSAERQKEGEISMDALEELKAENKELEDENKQLEAENKELEAKIEDLESKIPELKRIAGELAGFRKEYENLNSAKKKQEAETFYGKLRDDGKLPPAQFEKAVALDARLGEEDRKEMRAMFAALETKADLTGKHYADKKNASAPPASGDGLSAKIRAFQKEHKLASFADAASALHAEKPELFEEEDGND